METQVKKTQKEWKYNLEKSSDLEKYPQTFGVLIDLLWWLSMTLEKRILSTSNAPTVLRGPEYKSSILRVDIKHAKLKGLQYTFEHPPSILAITSL